MSQTTIEHRFDSIARVFALLLFALGAGGIVGIGLQLPALIKLEGLEAKPPVVLVLICYVVIAVAIWTMRRRPCSWFTRAAGVFVGFLALRNLLEFGAVEFGILSQAYVTHIASLPTSLSLLFLGLSLLCVDTEASSTRRAVHILLAFTLALSLTSLIGYTYGFDSLTTMGFPAQLHVESPFLAVVASIGLICSRPREGIFSITISPTTAGKMARILLPTVIVLPFLGVISGIGNNASSDLLLVLNLVLYGLPTLILISTSVLEKVELQRETAYGQSQELNVKLQGQLLELQKKTNSLQESLNIRGQLIANVNHELRTPLHSILGTTQFLLARPNVVNREQVQIIENAAEQLLDLVNRMLSFSELRAGTLPVNPVEFNPKSVALRCVESASWLADSKKIKVSVDWSDDLPALVRTDETLVESILRSLLDNAIKFTDGGEVTLRFSVSQGEPNNYLCLSVQDTGLGMTSEQLQQVATPFEQGDTSFRRKHGGLGLGLALVRQVVELLSGELQVHSKPGVGTQVDVRIPILPQAELTRSIRVGRQLSRRVLIVEDSTVNAAVLSKLVGHLGVEADIVFTGAEAVEEAKSGKYGLILMDVQMPEMDGLEATRQIRNLPPPTCDVPIVAVTAHATDADRQKCVLSGMNDFMTKPVRAALLKELLAKWLGKSDETQNHNAA